MVPQQVMDWLKSLSPELISRVLRVSVTLLGGLFLVRLIANSIGPRGPIGATGRHTVQHCVPKNPYFFLLLDGFDSPRRTEFEPGSERSSSDPADSSSASVCRDVRAR